jgi:phosphoribosyl-ATP pyrophosphohydrolase/phosphoribosyl-AMP cyclohydrolase
VIIPSIDLLGGKAVQLRRGNPEDCALTVDDPVALAEQYARYGEVAVIDLDAALGRGDNLALVEAITARVEARVGGGIRDHAKADRLLRAGAKRLIIGTVATPEFLRRYPRDVLTVALDAKKGRVVTQGWTQTTEDTPVQRAQALAPYCAEFLFTVVDREGMMGGTDLDAVRAVVEATGNHVVAAGGITTVDEVVALDRMGASCQLGMAIYTGRLDLADAYLALLDWDKCQGLLPVVTQDASGQVLMVAHATREALRQTLTTGQATYWSRSRQGLWIKGETSGHRQHVLAVRWDCDRDALLYTVRQTGHACHLPQYGCFGDRKFTLPVLEEVLQARMLDADAGSYTGKLLADEGLIKAKILEEAQELVDAPTDRDAVWEAADVVFFTLALLARRGLTWAQVEKELRGRQGRRRDG